MEEEELTDDQGVEDKDEEIERAVFFQKYWTGFINCIILTTFYSSIFLHLQGNSKVKEVLDLNSKDLLYPQVSLFCIEMWFWDRNKMALQHNQ